MNRILAEAIMLAHFVFLVYLTLGGFLAWRWRWAIVPHLAAVTWGVLIVVFAWTCPLTRWENHFRLASGVGKLRGGFIATYIDGVIYPEKYVDLARFAVGLIVAISWVGWWLLWRRRADGPLRGADRRRDGRRRDGRTGDGRTGDGRTGDGRTGDGRRREGRRSDTR